jgi:hypothetical protein
MPRPTSTTLLLAALGAVAVLAMTNAPALAGKGNGGNTTTQSSIAIATIDGARMAAATSSPTPAIGDALTFATTVEPLAGWEYPMVVVSCYQDVNRDGTVDTNLLGPDVVYTWLDRPSATFILGASQSIWTLRGGGPATCRAELDAYGWKGGKESIRVLASTGDWAASG